MKHVHTFVTALLIGVALSLSACGGANVTSTNTSTSKGQQLMDLEKAYKAGIITEKEYNNQREMILKAKY